MAAPHPEHAPGNQLAPPYNTSYAAGEINYGIANEIGPSPQDKQFGQDVKGTTVNVRSPESGSLLSRRRERIPKIWEPFMHYKLVVLGFFAIAMVFACIIAEIVVLVTSDKKAQEQWPNKRRLKNNGQQARQITPAVVLAILNTVSTVSLAVAIGQGVAVAWWRKAMRGATVKELHKSYGYSTNVLELATAGKYFNMIALAALAAKFALIDNLLLQRAAGSGPGTYKTNDVKISLPVVPELDADYLGEFTGDGSSGAISDPFSQALYHYSTEGEMILFNTTWQSYWNYKTQTSVSTFDTHCYGFCEAQIPAFGFRVDCADPIVSPTFAITPEIVLANQQAMRSGIATSSTSAFSPTILQVNSSAITSGQSWHSSGSKMLNVSSGAILLNVTFNRFQPSDGNSSNVATETCNGRIIQRTCVLRPAIINYDVEVVNLTEINGQNGIRIAPKLEAGLTDLRLNSTDSLITNGQLPGYNVSRPAYEPYTADYDTNILAIDKLIKSMFGAYVNLEYVNGTNGGYVPSAEIFSPLSAWWEGAFATRPGRKSCMINMVDPIPWVVGQLNAIMLRASVYAAVELERTDPDYFSVNTTRVLRDIYSVQTIETVIYHSQYGYMIGAVVTVFVCILCIIPSYWGFWELKHDMTLEPMEIASAFQAPALVSTQGRGEGGINRLMKEVGGTKIRYGEISGTGRVGLDRDEHLREAEPVAPLRQQAQFALKRVSTHLGLQAGVPRG